MTIVARVWLVFGLFVLTGCFAATPSKESTAAVTAEAQIWLPRILSDNAVLQANTAVPIWGRATPDSRVTVRFNGHTIDAEVSGQGQFLASLPPSPPNGTGQPLTITSDDGADKTVRNVIIGDVWLASGQSNMAWSLAQVENGNQDALAADDNQLRFFKVGHRPRLIDDGGDVAGSWITMRPGRVFHISAVAYHFGRVLRAETQIPVGVVQSSWGGTRVEAWMPSDLILSDPDLADEAQNLRDARSQHATNRRKGAAELERWGQSTKRASDTQLLTMRPPSWPQFGAKNTASVLYTGMIDPLLPISVRGVIWYQGESNGQNKPALYAQRLTMMIAAWRAQLGGDVPFGIVQIAPFAPRPSFNIIRNAQLHVANTVDDTGMVVITDLVDDLDNIHPRQKRQVGERLAAWALRDVYALSDTAYVGPLFQSAQFDDGQITVTFRFGEGLATRDGKPLAHVEVAGPDGAFVPARAEIDGTTLVIDAAGTGNPCQIRYEYRADTNPQLTNTTGLPGSPFAYSACEPE